MDHGMRVVSRILEVIRSAPPPILTKKIS
jgi:hypothetical protein